MYKEKIQMTNINITWHLEIKKYNQYKIIHLSQTLKTKKNEFRFYVEFRLARTKCRSHCFCSHCCGMLCHGFVWEWSNLRREQVLSVLTTWHCKHWGFYVLLFCEYRTLLDVQHWYKYACCRLCFSHALRSCVVHQEHHQVV